MKYFFNFFGIYLIAALLPAVLFAQNNHEIAETKDTSIHKLPHWAFGGFVRPASANPVISPEAASQFKDPITGKLTDWESNDTFNPGAVVKDGKIVILYRAEDKSGVEIGHRTSRLGFAESTNGTEFIRRATPVFFPANDDQKPYEWPGGCEDPRIAVTEDGTFVMFYTQWNRHIPRLGVATSKNLIDWKKHGPIFKNAKGNIVNLPHKSASIVTKLKGDKQVIAKINGKYVMYWGEEGVFLATSDNLLAWEPLLGEDGKPEPLIAPRAGFFDSDLTECGPPAIITDNGILLMYNGKNNGKGKGDNRFNKNSYCAAQVLFDLNDPTKVIGRLDVPFLRPMAPFEKSGQYENGTVFIQGLVYFKKKWFLYYGCADSRVGVAVYDPANPAPPDPIPTSRKSAQTSKMEIDAST